MAAAAFAGASDGVLPALLLRKLVCLNLDESSSTSRASWRSWNLVKHYFVFRTTLKLVCVYLGRVPLLDAHVHLAVLWGDGVAVRLHRLDVGVDLAHRAQDRSELVGQPRPVNYSM